MHLENLKRAFLEEQKSKPFEFLYNSIFSVLQQAIITEKLPSGTHLKDGDIARALQISRTPVTRAFALLKDNNFLSPCTTGEYVVSAMSYNLLHDLVELRATLEPPLCCTAAKTRTDDATERIRRIMTSFRSLPLNSMSRDEITMASYKAETHFFAEICDICPNEYIANAYKLYLPQINRSIFFITRYCHSPDGGRPADDFLQGVMPVYHSIKASNGYMAMDAIYSYLRRVDIRKIKFDNPAT